MISSRIKQKKYSWGATALATALPAHGSVSIVGSLSGGSMRAPSEEFAHVHAQMLLEGTQTHTKREIQILLDSIGAAISFSSSNERLVFSGRVRAPHLSLLLALIAEVLREPSFPKVELATLKKREHASLALESEDTNTQARIHLTHLLYKKGHPNYSDTTHESRKALVKMRTETLRRHHKKILNGSSLVISLAGDINPKKVFAEVEKHFKNLPRTKSRAIKFAKAPQAKSQKASVPIKNKASVDLMLGITTGITDAHADYPALLLGLKILANPGFTGRLMQHVREKEGLTYGTNGYLGGFDYGADGHIALLGTFAPQLLKAGRDSIMRQVKLIVREGASKEEVKKHAIMYEAGRRVRMSNSSAFAREAHAIVVENRKPSYIDEFPKKVLKLSQKQVNAALKKYLIPEKLSESAAGPVASSKPVR